jgi:transcription antitermination factor NusG
MPSPYNQLYDEEAGHAVIEATPIVSGNIGSSSSRQQPTQRQQPQMENTLDEPVKVTIMRDLSNIWNKVKQVLDPRSSDKNLLKDWDWWGPLLLCLVLSTYTILT